MSKLIAETEEQHKQIGKILGSNSCVYQKGVIVDRLISYEEMAAIADYLRSPQESPEHVGSEFNENWLKVGDMVTGYNQNGVFYGEVNHIDGRDVVIVMDYQCSMPFPPMLKPDLRGLEEPEQHRIEETDTLDINKMRKEFKELAAKWRKKAGDADISVEVWSHTRGNPIQRYDAAPIIIDICCDASVKGLEL